MGVQPSLTIGPIIWASNLIKTQIVKILNRYLMNLVFNYLMKVLLLLPICFAIIITHFCGFQKILYFFMYCTVHFICVGYKDVARILFYFIFFFGGGEHQTKFPVASPDIRVRGKTFSKNLLNKDF